MTALAGWPRRGVVLLRILIWARSDVGEGEGEHTIHTAAIHGDVTSLELLLSSRSDSAAKSNDGFTPLHLGVLGGHYAIVRSLLRWSLGKSIQNAIIQVEVAGNAPLHDAARLGHTDIAALLLRHMEGDHVAGMNRLLGIAGAQGHLPMVELLLMQGATVEPNDLVEASKSGHAEIVRHLNIAMARTAIGKNSRVQAPLQRIKFGVESGGKVFPFTYSEAPTSDSANEELTREDCSSNVFAPLPSCTIVPSSQLLREVTAFCAYLGLPGTESCIQPVADRAAKLLIRLRPATHGLTPQFFSIAADVFKGAFGAEQIAPLLHALVRFHRPLQVVELGFGYTTPFIAQALADNSMNTMSEQGKENAQRLGRVLHDAWYQTDIARKILPQLHVVDDLSQRGADNQGRGTFAKKVSSVLENLKLSKFVVSHPSATASNAHRLFQADSLGMVWNDAVVSMDWLRVWWPLLKKDGGMLLVHNVMGEGELFRWTTISPRRLIQELFPNETFEFMTLLEPHKSHQSSLAMLRRLDPAQRPRQVNHSSQAFKV